MNYKIIIILVLLIVIIIGSVIAYFFLIKNKSTSQPPSTSQTPAIDNTPKDAICSSNGVSIDGKTTESITAENKDENYTFDIMKLGRHIKSSVERFMFPERFALSSSTTSDINSLINDSYYFIGSIKPETQVNTTTPSINGGRGCLQFPSIIYKNSGMAGPIINTFLISTRDWYPYGATANFVKSTIGITDLQSAINYANNNGYTAFSFNQTSNSTDPNDINSRILLFKEADINLTTFWTNGAAISGFRIYALGFSKLGNCPTNSIFNNINGDCICNSGFQKAPGRTGRNDPCYSICPISGSTMDINGVCTPPPCPAEQTRINGVCQWNACPTDKTRDANGICQWNPCPIDKTRDVNGVCQWNACPTDKTRDANGICQWNPCPIDKTRDANGICQWNPCPINSTVNTTSGDCICNINFQKAPGRTGRNDPCFSLCLSNSTMDYYGNCNCSSKYVRTSGTVERPICSCIYPNIVLGDGTCGLPVVNWNLQCPSGYSIAYDPLTNQTRCQPDYMLSFSGLITG